MSDVHRAGVLYRLLFDGLYPELIGGKAIHTIPPLVTFFTLFSTRLYSGILVTYPPVATLDVRYEAVRPVIAGKEPIEIRHRSLGFVPLSPRIVRIVHTCGHIFLPHLISRLAINAVLAIRAVFPF